MWELILKKHGALARRALAPRLECLEPLIAASLTGCYTSLKFPWAAQSEVSPLNVRCPGSGMPAITWLALAVIAPGCLNYSSYQDAHIVERGASQGTIAVSASKLQSEYDHDDFDWIVIDGNPRWGVGARFDAGLKLSVLAAESAVGSVVVGGDIRFGAIPDYLVVTLPIATAIGEYAISTTTIQPGFILTLPVHESIDINGSVRHSFYLFEEVPYSWWLYNAGLGIMIAPGWRLRPELGWMVSDGEDERSTYVQFGIGVTHEVH